jgi:ribose/xylose/arabinose/galactoside ABC-type transport system permease subunit
MVIFFAVNLPETFLTPRNLLNVSQQISMLAVVAFTMTVVMSMGDFDLSVGTMASLAGVVAATLFVAGWPVPGRSRRRSGPVYWAGSSTGFSSASSASCPSSRRSGR